MISHVFRAENLKLKRSFLLYLHVIVLFLYPIMMALYLGGRKRIISPDRIITVYFDILALATPIIISIVISLVYDREEKAGHFKNWLSESIEKQRLIQLQLDYYYFLYIIEIVGMSLIFYGFIFAFYQVNTISCLKFLLTVLGFALLGFCQYEIAELFALKWGTGGCLILGFFGTVITFLGPTVLLDWIWPILPWAWQIRLNTFWQNGISDSLIKITLAEYLLPLILTNIIIRLALRYFKKWQGK